MPFAMTCTALAGLPEIREGDDLAGLVIAAANDAGAGLRDGDVLVLCQKIVSKTEGRLVDLATVRPSAEAERLARETSKDPRLVELILGESMAIVRALPGLLIVQHRLGFTVANAGVDQSNLPGGDEQALLLPRDPDQSARTVRRAVRDRIGADVAVVINDSFGRPWRKGTCGVAIGCDGMIALHDLRGRTDRHGRILQSSEVAIADEIAAAASLMMGQGAEGRPAVLIRGLPGIVADGGSAGQLVRPIDEDLFR